MIDYEKIFWKNFAKWSETHWKGTDGELAYRLNVSPPQLNNLKMGRRVGNENQRRWICKDLGLVYDNMIEIKPEPESEEPMELTRKEIIKLLNIAENNSSMAAGYQKDIRDLRDEIKDLAKEVASLKAQCESTRSGIVDIVKKRAK